MTSGFRSILLVSHLPEDRTAFHEIFGRGRWSLYQAETFSEARRTLGGHLVDVVLCEQELPDGDWDDLLRYLRVFERPPQLIVLSRLGDDRLWSRVLNLGGYDVLAKPLNRFEVIRIVGQAMRQGEELNSTRAVNASAAARPSTGCF